MIPLQYITDEGLSVLEDMIRRERKLRFEEKSKDWEPVAYLNPDTDIVNKIKVYRAKYGCSLLEAKWLVERWHK